LELAVVYRSLHSYVLRVRVFEEGHFSQCIIQFIDSIKIHLKLVGLRAACTVLVAQLATSSEKVVEITNSCI